MSRQDKATTDRNARTLRDLVRQEGNKNCADCKKNDARWASWNLGVYLCIRCSGIHRSMGTHISKVKSIDLDIWQPEQMDSMKKWGNKRANLYWEAHLKPGHHPPDHKIESFIRSKYESRKWVLSDHPPRDPSVLEEGGNGGGSDGRHQGEPPRYDPPISGGSMGRNGSGPSQSQQQQQQQQQQGRTQHPLLSSMSGSSRTGRSTATVGTAPPAPTQTVKKQPEVDLLSGDFGDFAGAAPTPTPTTGQGQPASRTAPPPAIPGGRPASPTATTAPATSTSNPNPASPIPTQAQTSAKPTPSSSLFDLDFRPPSTSGGASGNGVGMGKTSNMDILSLFSSAPTPPSAPVPGMMRQTSGFGQEMPQQQYQQQQYQQQQQQQQQPRPAVYGQEAYNSPPAYQSNPQQAYASWGNGSGATSTSTTMGGVGGMTSGFAGMGLGSDPWSSAGSASVKTAQTSQPSQTQYQQQARPQPNNSQPNSNSSHFVSSQDVWGGTAAPLAAPILDTGFGAFGGSGAGGGGAKKALDDDPFQNIWK